MDGGAVQALKQHDIKAQVKKATSKRRARYAMETKKQEFCAANSDPKTSDACISDAGFVDAESLFARCGLTGAQASCSKADVHTQASRSTSYAHISSASRKQHETDLVSYFWDQLYASRHAYLSLSAIHAGQRWLSVTLTKFQPLADLTLALSAYHYLNSTPSSTLQDKSMWRLYYDRGIRGLRSEIQAYGDLLPFEDARTALRLLACSMQLILLSDDSGSRLVHLKGTSELMHTVVAFYLSPEFEGLGDVDHDGLEFIVQVFVRFNSYSFV